MARTLFSFRVAPLPSSQPLIVSIHTILSTLTRIAIDLLQSNHHRQLLDYDTFQMKISARMAVIAVAWPILFLRRVEQLLKSYSSTTFNAFSMNEAIPATRDVDMVLIIATVP